MLTIAPRTAVEVDEGVKRIASFCKKVAGEIVPLTEALGRVLACELLSPFPVPSFRKAAMDGYAVRFCDIEEATVECPITLPMIGEIRAGMLPALDAGPMPQVHRIFTGAPVPEPYDTVIMQEAVQVIEGSPIRVQFTIPTEQGKHVAQIGEDIAEGSPILHAGTVISSKELAILASFGLESVEVYRKPTAVVIPVGDELQQPGELLKPNHIFDANGIMIEARLKEIGISCIRNAPVPDDPAMITSAIRTAVQQGDIVITIGGVSVGKYDYVLPVMEQLACEPLFTKVRMRPGAPTSAFVMDGKLSFHLSGNPSACFNGFELFVKPAAHFLAGHRSWQQDRIEAVLAEDVRKPCPSTRYIRSRAVFRDGWLVVEPLSGDRSGNVAAFAAANALAIIPPGGRGAVKGQAVLMQWLS